MKCFTEAELKDLMRKVWQHGYENGARDADPFNNTKTAFIQGGMAECIMEGKLIQLLGEV